jgi:hypothetical protein
MSDDSYSRYQFRARPSYPNKLVFSVILSLRISLKLSHVMWRVRLMVYYDQVNLDVLGLILMANLNTYNLHQKMGQCLKIQFLG